jgi:LPXTG-motif cell wall-anchored protein
MNVVWEPNVKKLSAFGAVVLAALVAVLAMLGLPMPAQAYPELFIDLAASPHVLYGGQSFTATAKSNVTCSWTIEWNGVVRHGESKTGSDFNTVYRAPRVSRTTKIPLHGTCAYDAAETPTAARATGASATFSRTIMITVLPRSSAVSAPGGSDLPNTGGPNLLFLLGGLALVVSGATAVSVARRRAEEADIQASGA